MPVIIHCDNPKTFLTTLKEATTGDKKTIETWLCDADGDFNYAVAQYQESGKKAWLRPTTQASQITLTCLPPKDKTIPNEIQAIYEGRFIEMLLSHFRGKFNRIEAR